MSEIMPEMTFTREYMDSIAEMEPELQNLTSSEIDAELKKRLYAKAADAYEKSLQPTDNPNIRFSLVSGKYLALRQASYYQNQKDYYARVRAVYESGQGWVKARSLGPVILETEGYNV